MAIALPLALPGCTCSAAGPLAEEVVKQIVLYAALEVAKPVMEPIIKEITGGLGVRNADAATVNGAVNAGVMEEWQKTHDGKVTYLCGTQAQKQCEAAAKAEAQTLAQDHAARFQLTYASCKKQVNDHGTGGFMQSIREINECTAKNGFAPEIGMIIRFASST